MRITISLIALFVVIPSFAATAYVLDQPTEQKFNLIFGNTSRRTWSVEDRVLRTLIGRTSPIPGAFASNDTARQPLQEYLGLGVEQLRLNSVRTIASQEGAHYEFTQVMEVQSGQVATIENASIVIDVNNFDEIVGLTNQTLKNPNLASSAPALSSAAGKCFAAVALLSVAANCDGPVPQLPPGADSLEMSVSQTLYAVPPLVRWAWAVEVSSNELHVYRRYVIDAQGGFVLEVRDRVHYAGPHALVFNPNPFTDPVVTSADNVSLNTPSFPPYLDVTLDDLSPASGGLRRLASDFVHVVDLDNKHIGVIDDDIAIQEGTDFSDQRGTSRFASAMAYYHIDALQRYVKGLGFSVIPALRVDVRRDPFDWKSEYTNKPVGGGFLLFGYLNDGALFQAEDGDVVVHEYGHAVQASQSADRFDRGDKQTVAMSEGFSDYWAMSYFEKPKADSHRDLFCMGEWIKRIGGDLGCTRTIKPNATFDDFKMSNDDYDNATVWTAALWAIRTYLGDRQQGDKLIIRSFESVLKDSPVSGPDFASGARGIFVADGLLNRGANYDALCNIFDQRKILKKEDCPPHTN